MTPRSPAPLSDAERRGEARADLASLRNGPAPDAWWAKRWGWKARDVHTLKTTCPRERDPLPWLP